MSKNKRPVTAFSRKQSVIATGLALSLMAAHSVYAQQAAPVAQKIEKIEVTGSSIKQIEGETAQFVFADSNSPTIVRDPADVGALYVIMPMRV